MQQPTDYKPTNDDVKHIWSDTYNLFLKYKDSDCIDKTDEIVKQYCEISDKYHNCDIAERMISTVLRIFLDRSNRYQELVKGDSK